MQINLFELFAADGLVREYEVPVDMEVFSCREGEYPLVEKEPVHLTATHIGDRCIQLQCRVKLKLQIPCDRCLTPVEVPFDLIVEKELEGKQETEDADDSDEAYYYSGYYLDVDKLVYGELIVNLPMKVLCSPDCKGICKRCGKNLNEGSCTCSDTEPDPRMAAIRDIFKNFKEV